MATPLSKTGRGVWLARQDQDDPHLNPNYRRSVKYYRRLYQQWPGCPFEQLEIDL